MLTDTLYLKQIAENLEALSGTSGVEENSNVSGYLKRIEEASELLAAQGGIPSGVAFPSSPATDSTFRRTDRHIDYYYDGTRWLSQQLHTLSFRGAALLSASDNGFLPVPHFGTYGLWLVDWTVGISRSAVGEWDVALYRRTAGNTGTLMDTHDGVADATTNWVNEVRPLGAVLDASAAVLQVVYTEVSGSATINAGVLLSYRLIG